MEAAKGRPVFRAACGWFAANKANTQDSKDKSSTQRAWIAHAMSETCCILGSMKTENYYLQL